MILLLVRCLRIFPGIVGVVIGLPFIGCGCKLVAVTDWGVAGVFPRPTIKLNRLFSSIISFFIGEPPAAPLRVFRCWCGWILLLLALETLGPVIGVLVEMALFQGNRRLPLSRINEGGCGDDRVEVVDETKGSAPTLNTVVAWTKQKQRKLIS